jgi:hypothetical protein
MSIGTWILDDLSESMDIKEDDSKVTKVRKHIVIAIHCQLLASTPPNTLSIGEERMSITYHVGGYSRSNNPRGSGKFICVGDGLTPIAHPGDYVYRRQTWEFFGPWENAPAGWNQ